MNKEDLLDMNINYDSLKIDFFYCRNLPHRDVKSNRKNRPSKKNKHNFNEQ